MASRYSEGGYPREAWVQPPPYEGDQPRVAPPLAGLPECQIAYLP